MQWDLEIKPSGNQDWAAKNGESVRSSVYKVKNPIRPRNNQLLARLSEAREDWSTANF